MVYIIYEMVGDSYENKGFTLVELLSNSGTAIILTIAVPNVIKIIDKAKQIHMKDKRI